MALKQRWGMAVVAGIMAEVVIIATIMLAIVVIKKTMGATARGMVMAHTTAAWTELLWGPVIVFLFTRWIVRPLASLHIPHALLIAALAVAGQLSLFTSTVREGHAPLWIVVLAVVVKIAAAVLAATLARRSGST